MESAAIELLLQIKGGVAIYEPLGRTPWDLQKFQDTVERLKEMEREGQINRLFLQFRSGFQVEDQIELVMVQGGLTDKGERLLEQHS